MYRNVEEFGKRLFNRLGRTYGRCQHDWRKQCRARRLIPALNRQSFILGYSQLNPLVYLHRNYHQVAIKMADDMSQWTFPNSQPVVSLDCDEAFKNLSKKEKLYAHHLSRAAWYGGLIVLVQTSPESPAVFSLLYRVLQSQPLQDLKTAAFAAGVSDDEFQALLVYTSGFLTNMGNYKGFGDSKFIPALPARKFEAIVKASKAYKDDSSALMELWTMCQRSLYNLDERSRQLGLGVKGVTTYFTPNCSAEDSERVSRFLLSRRLEAYNNRVLKFEEAGTTVYEVRCASAEAGSFAGVTQCDEVFEEATFRVTRGDYAPLLGLVAKELKEAGKYAANDAEVSMIENYVQSFTSGSLDKHKDGSRFWIRDKGPVIETYIGFIETYRDPAGMRGEFEGFVAMVNKEMSAKFGELVLKAETFLPLLPWSSEFEKDTFLRPDFTSLDVLTFAGSGIPAGINIPNYDEIRQDEGFKNVSLGNVIPASYKDSTVPFLSEDDVKLLNKHRVQAFEVQVGLHELLGHGSGKLLRKNSDGTFNFDKALLNPLTSSAIASWYEEGETYDSKFSTMGSAYEECRAECVGLYLSLDTDVLRIFGHEGEKAEEIKYVNWLSLLWNGVGKALEMYQPTTQAWLQAHSQARYVILRVLLEAKGGLVSVEAREGDDGKPDLRLTLDRTKLDTIGKEAIGKFLQKLQVYKSTGDIASARKMFGDYSKVPDGGDYPFGKWRQIALDRKQPRKMFVQSNTVLSGDGGVELRNYAATHEGLLQSWLERFPQPEAGTVCKNLLDLASADGRHFQ